MAVDIIAIKMTTIMTSAQPALMLVSANLRLITLTKRNTKVMNMIRTSRTTVTAGLNSLIAPTGLVSMTSGEDQAQKASPRTTNTTVNKIVKTVERRRSLLSGIPSLTVLYTDLGPRGFVFHS